MYITTVTTTTLIFAVVNVTLVAQEAVATAPEIVSRAQWGARAPKSQAPNLTRKPAPYVIVHHSASASCDTQAICQLRMREFQNYHMDTKGWSDIAYNFVVGEDGNIYEGRGWGKQGSHAKTFNNKSVGICIIGDYTNRTPHNAAIQAVERLIAYGVSSSEIKDDYKLLGHRQIWQTSCPGNRLYETIKLWPHWVQAA